MNIIEAAEAIQEGKTVTRTKFDRNTPPPEKLDVYAQRWAEGVRVDEEGAIVEEDGNPVFFTLAALLSDDWEIVE